MKIYHNYSIFIYLFSNESISLTDGIEENNKIKKIIEEKPDNLSINEYKNIFYSYRGILTSINEKRTSFHVKLLTLIDNLYIKYIFRNLIKKTLSYLQIKFVDNNFINDINFKIQDYTDLTYETNIDDTLVNQVDEYIKIVNNEKNEALKSQNDILKQHILELIFLMIEFPHYDRIIEIKSFIENIPKDPDEAEYEKCLQDIKEFRTGFYVCF